MKFRHFVFLVVACLVLPLAASNVYADTLGTAAAYAALATTQVTNPATNLAGTMLFGNLGAVSCTGFVAGTGCTLGFGTVSGATNLGNAPYLTALADSNIAYGALAATPSTFNFTGSCLGSSPGCLNNLAPGVYTTTDSVANLIGALTLAGGSNLAPLWIFQTAAGFTTASGSSVLVTGTGSSAGGIYWQIGSQATLGDTTSFQGNILAGTAVVFNPGAQITCGRAFTDTSGGTAVTFAGNKPATTTGTPNEISNSCTQSSSGFNGGVLKSVGGTIEVIPGTPASTPEPGTLGLLAFALAALLGLSMMRRTAQHSS